MALTSYRPNVLAVIREVLQDRTADRTLDFGCGDGWFARQLLALGTTRHIVGVEVQLRPGARGSIVQFDGLRLPFADRQFGLAMAVDVLHHCDDPIAALTELLRCSRTYLLLKDHTCRTRTDRGTLILLDELGNRRFGVPSPAHYQRDWEWLPAVEAAGFDLVKLVTHAPCHKGLLGRLTNHLQFVALWKRRDTVARTSGPP